jgi:uncharacterized protein YaeQ
MALKATIHKVELAVSDMDRGYYATHALTLARHPSETSERLMVRLLAFALYAGESLEFGRGLSADDEPTLWKKDLTGNIEHWIDVGLPTSACCARRRAVRSCHAGDFPGGRGAGIWWNANQAALERLEPRRIIDLPADATQSIATLVDVATWRSTPPSRTDMCSSAMPRTWCRSNRH